MPNQSVYWCIGEHIHRACHSLQPLGIMSGCVPPALLLQAVASIFVILVTRLRPWHIGLNKTQRDGKGPGEHQKFRKHIQAGFSPKRRDVAT